MKSQFTQWLNVCVCVLTMCLMNADFKYDGYWILLFCFIISANVQCVRLSHIISYVYVCIISKTYSYVHMLATVCDCGKTSDMRAFVSVSVDKINGEKRDEHNTFFHHFISFLSPSLSSCHSQQSNILKNVILIFLCTTTEHLARWILRLFFLRECWKIIALYHSSH